jgi:hypothetical protein
VKTPKAIVDAINGDLTGSAIPGLFGYKSLRHDDRTNCGEGRLKLRAVSQIGGELFTDETGAQDGMICSPEPMQYEITQAAPHGISNQQSAR